MANRYWVGGTANWDNIAGSKWSTTSGGSGGASVPTASDDVFFDANSGSGTVTAASSPFGDHRFCKNLNFTGFTGTFAGSQSVNVYGSLIFGSGMTLSYGHNFEMLATSGTFDITSNGKTSTYDIYIKGGATYKLGSDIEFNQLRPYKGDLDLNGYDMSVGSLWNVSSDASNIALGSKNLTVRGDTSEAIRIDNTGLTFTGTGYVKVIASTEVRIKSSLITIPKLWIALTGVKKVTITQNGNYGELKIDKGNSIEIQKNTTQTITDLVAIGESGELIELKSTESSGITLETAGTSYRKYNILTLTGGDNNAEIKVEGVPGLSGPIITFSVRNNGTGYTNGTVYSVTGGSGTGAEFKYNAGVADTWTLSKASGDVESDYLDLQGSIATGGATFYAGSHSVDSGGNSGWIFGDKNTFNPAFARRRLLL